MNFAVLTYRFVDNPLGIPADWPAEVRELRDGTTLPSGDWILMSESEYSAHKAQHQSAYDSWLTTYEQNRVTGDKFLSVVIGDRAFGEMLINTFTAENRLLGLTESGLSIHIRRTLDQVTNCLYMGLLNDAIAEIRIINQSTFDGTFLTSARMLALRNQIESYLGITRAGTWDE